MSLVAVKEFHPEKISMSIIEGPKLDEITGIFHNTLGLSISSEQKSLLLFSHYGDFNSDKNEHILKLVEAQVLEAGDKRQTMKRFCSLLIEVLQNISIHGARDRNRHMHAFVLISRTDSKYILTTGNLILKEDCSKLGTVLQELNGLDANSLRKLYIETLCNNEFSAKGGAGLGLLTVARKVDTPIRYEFSQIDSSLKYFRMYLEMTIGKAD